MQRLQAAAISTCYNSLMLVLTKSLINQPVMSLRTGGPVGYSIQPIIDPNNLKIEGFHCVDSVNKKKQLILLTQDIREVLPMGLVVDDHSSLSEPDELVRLRKLINTNFELLGKSVVTKSGSRVGKVNDYAVEPDSMIIKKLYVTQSLIKNLTGGSLGVDRSQIIEITGRKIVIKDPLQPMRAAISPLPAS